LLFVSAALVSIAYGIGSESIKSYADIMKGMSKSMEAPGSYIMLVFFAAQFVAYFNWSNIGLVGAVKGAELLKASGLGAIQLTISFILSSPYQIGNEQCIS
jgi:aminobenzoyl-glutamate transport protein